MQTTFSTTTLLSVYQWLDNKILQDGQAYTNTTTRLYYKPDERLGANFVTYQSPFKSFVWDSGVSGASIITSISGSFGTLSRGQSGMMVDYENGRVIMPASFGTDKIVSGSYAFKDFNVYFANQSQESIVFTNKYYLNSRFNRQINQTPPPYDMVTPAIFISNTHSENQNFAFGGVYNTSSIIGLTVLAENLNQLEGVLSLMVDSKHENFPQLDKSVWPLNFYGDFKSGYNYEGIIDQYGDPSNLYIISDVKATKVNDMAKINESIFVGLVDLTVQKVRRIR